LQDKQLIKCAFISPLFYRPYCDKPMFVIDSNTGMGSGKSRLVDMICKLYGDPMQPETSAPIEILPESINNEMNIERVYKRILSRTARQKRIIRIDNVTGYFKSDALASLVTQGFVSGMSPYAKGEESRPMDLQFFVTSNRASLCADLVSRSFIIHVSKPNNPIPNWEREVVEYINAHQLQIFADMIGIIERGYDYGCIGGVQPQSRFRSWESEVLMPVCETMDIYSTVWKEQHERRGSANGEIEETDTIRDYIAEHLAKAGFNPDKDAVFIHSDALRFLCQQVIPGYGGRTGRNIIHLLKLQNQAGHFDELTDAIKIYPYRGNSRRRGMLWCADAANMGSKTIRVAELVNMTIQEKHVF